MFTKSNLFGTFIGFIVFFILSVTVAYFPGYLDFIIEHQVFPDGGEKQYPIIWLALLAILFQSFFVSTVYGWLNKERHTFLNGLKIGLFFGVFAHLAFKFYHFSGYNHFDFILTLVDGLVTVIIIGIQAGMIALIYKATCK